MSYDMFDTSREAFESLSEEMLNRMHARITKEIWLAGEHGRTCDEIEVALSMRHQTASSCLRRLVLKGWIYDSGIRRRARSGRNQRVYWIIAVRVLSTLE